MTDERSRLASLTVVGGALAGLSHEIVDVVGEVLIGSDPDCQLCLELPSVSPIHARIWTELGQATVRNTSAPRGVYVNSTRVDTEAVFGAKDVLWLGPPNDPDSVCVQGRFEPWREVLPSVADGDPFFIAAETPAEAAPAAAAEAPETGPPPETPGPGPSSPLPVPLAVSPAGSPPAGEGGVLPGVPDDAWTIAEVPAQTAAPVELPSLAPPPSTEPVRVDDFFVADVPVPALPAPPPVVASPPTRPAAPTAPQASMPAPKGPGRPAPATPPAPARSAGGAPQPVPRGAPAARPAARSTPATQATGPAPARPPVPRTAPARPEKPSPDPVPPAPRPVTAPAPSAAAGTAAAGAPVAARPAVARPAVARPAARPAAAHQTAARPAVARPAARPSAVGRRPAARSSKRRPGGLPVWLKVSLSGAATLAVAAAVASWWILGAVKVDAIEPTRVRVGQRAVLRGQGFSADPQANLVLFGGKQAKVLEASSARLEVEVPEAVSEAGSEQRVSLQVRRGRRSSKPLVVLVMQGPRLHALSPQAALPGEEVVLAGAGLGLGATVRFGDVPAQVTEADASRIRVVVPEIAGGPGTSAPVVVSMGGADSNAAPFVVGHLPVVTAVQPESARPGEVVHLSGLGFLPDPLQDEVQIGGVAALVVSASDTTLDVVVPLVGPGEPARAVVVRVTGGDNVASASLEVPPPAESIGARFVAEPFSSGSKQPLAVVATDLGPAFVLAASGGRTAAQRALEAQERINKAVDVLSTTLGLTVEARGFGNHPAIGLAGRPDLLLEVTPEDAAAYGEDWTGLRGRGGPVTPDRLARWWEAVCRDLVLLLVRGERPHYAAQLAVEGRVLGQVFALARKEGESGVPRSALEKGRPPLRDALRLLGLRVPATVTAPAPRGAAGPSPVGRPTATPAPRVPPLEGTLRGSELEGGERRYLTAVFERDGGSIAFEGGITLTMPMLSLERHGSDQVRFTVHIRGGVRYYAGKWDGRSLAGTISSDPAGKEALGTFELHR